MQRFRGGLVFKAQRLYVSLNSRLESNKEEEDEVDDGMRASILTARVRVVHLGPIVTP